MTDFDKLDKMFMLQFELQKELGNLIIMGNDQGSWQRYVNIMTLALVDETMEMLRETSYKNPNYVVGGWKKTQETHLEQMRDEIVDMWHFLLNLTMAAGFTPNELFIMYERKNLENIQRHRDDY